MSKGCIVSIVPWNFLDYSFLESLIYGRKKLLRGLGEFVSLRTSLVCLTYWCLELRHKPNKTFENLRKGL